jgi:hypothetical protein
MHARINFSARLNMLKEKGINARPSSDGRQMQFVLIHTSGDALIDCSMASPKGLLCDGVSSQTATGADLQFATLGLVLLIRGRNQLPHGFITGIVALELQQFSPLSRQCPLLLCTTDILFSDE